MNAFMLKSIVRRAKQLLIRLALVEGAVMLAGHETDVFNFELTDDVFEPRQPTAPFFGIIAVVRQVAGKHDKVRLFSQAIHCRNRLR